MFAVGVEQFQSGLNRVEVTVSHDVCGRASLRLEFHIPNPPEGRQHSLYTTRQTTSLSQYVG